MDYPSSRNELFKYIESQKEQITRYETRLRDLILAYKNVCKEKEALEATVKVLTQGKKTKLSPGDIQQGKTEKELSASTESLPQSTGQDSVRTPVYDHDQSTDWHPLAAENFDDKDRANEERGESTDNSQETDELREQLSTLSSTLTTVMEQKKKMEAGFQADKKKLLQEQQLLSEQYTIEKEQQQSTIQQLEEQVTELRGRMRQEQLAREDDNKNHGLMLREIQLLLSTERTAKEDLENQLEEAKEKAAALVRQAPDKTEEFKQKVSMLSEELAAVKDKLRQSEEKVLEPSPEVLRLQNDLVKMKQEYSLLLSTERARCKEADEKLKIVSMMEEERVADLESKISELSEVVGSYERVRLQDQLTIQKLKDRLQQLDVENCVLLRRSGSDSDQDNSLSQIETLQNQVKTLKGFIKLTLEKTGKQQTFSNVDIEALSRSDLESMLQNDPLHKVCKDELKQLKDEFERYKTKTHVLYKNKNIKDAAALSEDLDKLKTRNEDLEKQNKALKTYYEDRDKDHRDKIQRLEKDLSDCHVSHKDKLEDAEGVYKKRLRDLEQQVQKQRMRTLELIAEKEQEVEDAKSHGPGDTSPAPAREESFQYLRKFVNPPNPSVQRDTEGAFSQDTESTVHQLLAQPSMIAHHYDGNLVHFAQQQARTDAEVAHLRVVVLDLEGALRDGELREEKLLEQCNALKEEIRKLERNRSRESANLEYLKNVVLRYMQATDTGKGREQMFKAIATILQFSPQEVAEVRKHMTAGWWG